MKQKILFSIVMAASITTYAQTEKKSTGYVITGPQKGQTSWKNVRLVDIKTGEELKTLYSPTAPEPEILNARTGKPVVKKDAVAPQASEAENVRIIIKGRKPGEAVKVFNLKDLEDLKSLKALQDLVPPPPPPASPATPAEATRATRATPATPATPAAPAIEAKLKNIDVHVVTNVNGTTKTITINRNHNVDVNVNSNVNINEERQRVITIRNHHFSRAFEPKTDAPFATNSAALAYDKKHDRLYYTPMGINQLRYIDLKSNTPKIYYFEDETFGVVTGTWDGANQIARMVIASDGNGYALSNNSEHLMRFTTGKKPVITDLGALTDDPANGEYTVNSRRNYGGDIVADKDENLYLFTANRRVYKISIESKVATYLGTIQGLPEGYSTNGAMADAGSKVIVCSSESTEGYYKVDVNTLQAEKASTAEGVYNASDLANGNLLFEKEEEKKEEIMPVLAYQAKAVPVQNVADGITLYPNPVFDKTVKLSFANQPAGEYKIQLMELSGKVISVRDVTINSKVQQIQFNLPQIMAKGSYLVKTTSDVNKISVVNKLIVE